MYFRAKQHLYKIGEEYNREQSCGHLTSGFLTCSISDQLIT